ncbi:MAG: nitrate/nitrite transporter [Candidatus Limnocylindrales bacterium]
MPSEHRRRALALICLSALAVATNYTNHGPILGFIRADFGIVAAQAGAIATAFFLGAAATMLFGGIIADRIGTKPAVTAGFLIVVISNLGIGIAAPTFDALLAWRVLGGLGGGFSFAAGSSYTRSIFDDRGRHFAQGLYGAAFLLGSSLTLIVIPWLAGVEGDWHRAYTISALFVAAIWLAWTLFAPRGSTPSGQGGMGAAFMRAVRARNTIILALCHMCGFGMAMVIGTWVTLYLSETFGLGLALAGALGTTALVLGIVGRLSGGGILEAGVRPIRLIRAALVAAAIGLAGMALATTVAAPAGLALAGVAIVATGLGVGLPYAAVFNGAAASVPDSPASAQAIVGWGGLLIAIVGPPLVGGLLDLSGGFAAGFLVLAAVPALVLVATTQLRPFEMEAPGGIEVEMDPASA